MYIKIENPQGPNGKIYSFIRSICIKMGGEFFFEKYVDSRKEGFYTLEYLEIWEKEDPKNNKMKLRVRRDQLDMSNADEDGVLGELLEYIINFSLYTMPHIADDGSYTIPTFKLPFMKNTNQSL